jgi:hypothetical protein
MQASGGVAITARWCALFAAAILATWLSRADPAEEPGAGVERHVRIAFQAVRPCGGELRVRDAPNGPEWVVWGWRVRPDEELLSSHASLSPDRTRLLLAQEWLTGPERERRCKLVLADVADPFPHARELEDTEGLVRFRRYPVWLDNSVVSFEAGRTVGSSEVLHEVRWSLKADGPPEQVSGPAGDLGRRADLEVRRVRDTLARLPRALLPDDLGQAVDDGRELTPSPDGLSATLPWIEVLIRSSASVAPSGRMVAIAKLGRSVVVVDDTGGQRQSAPALTIFPGEATVIEELHWGPGDRWLLWTERHYQNTGPPSGVAKGDQWTESLTVVRAMDMQSGDALTLASGEDAFLVR